MSLQDAVDYLKKGITNTSLVTTNNENCIKLCKDASGSGVVVSGIPINFDFGEYSYTFTESEGIRVEEGAQQYTVF